RTGVLALKIGVVPQWTIDGKKFYCTLLQVLDNHVISYKSPEESSSNMFKNVNMTLGTLVVGALGTENRKFTKAYCGLFKNAGVLPKRKLSKFAVSPESALQPGTPLNASHFMVGNFVDAQAKTIGHGFQGVVKRWGFKGGPASHGTTKWHRRPGNIGGGRGKGKVFKGKKMPGHMGMEWRTTRGLKIWRINTKYNVIYVHGQAIPGPTNCYVRLFDTVVSKKRSLMLQNPPPVPTCHISKAVDDDIYDENLFNF
ncbi:hypothetical protein HELRODRAFT_121430, partial [Helobdella robusta]|uniref:Large ribosomal subunit protein uL3m n=1 Tax=Helobdella robusta TaxID=6412 RepID=T1EGS0_HELRO